MVLNRNRRDKVKFLIATISALIAVLALIPAANAQCVPGAPCVTSDYSTGDNANDDKRGESATCDGDFMNQIYARAFMEASRETMMAQTYIRKPDSTLEYTCFDRFLNHAAANAPPLFSESTRWDGVNVPLNIAYSDAGNPDEIPLSVNMGSGLIISHLTDVVSSAMSAYLGNFSHEFLGGTGGMNSSIASSTSSGSYTCETMTAIWNLAKCQNFEDGPTLFMTFEELAATDPRQFPELGACESPITTELINTAQNAAPAYPASEFDRLDLFLDRVAPATSDAECLSPIDTGITVMIYEFVDGDSTQANPSGVTRQGVEVNDKVCVNPGCYYHVDVTYGGGPGGGGSVNNEECRRG